MMCQTFKAQLDPLPAVAFAAVFAAYFAVQTRVRKAMEAMEKREKLETELKCVHQDHALVVSQARIRQNRQFAMPFWLLLYDGKAEGSLSFYLCTKGNG